MIERQKEIERLLRSLPAENTEGIVPATNEQIETFREKCQEFGVDSIVVEQLVDFYSIANNFMYEVVFGFHSCTDELIFEWWEDGELWLGQRDFNTLRWADGKFCLGDAGSISYSQENEYDSLVDLIKGCIKEINELDEI